MSGGAGGGEPPLFAGLVHGIRVWTLDWADDGTAALTGNAGFAWSRGGEPTEARCTSRDCEGPPGTDCSCGLYALHPHRVEDDHFALPVVAGDPLTIAGIVAAWGRVEVHIDGFRARYARPVLLAAVGVAAESDYGRLVAEIARVHGAEPAFVDDLADLVEICSVRGLGLDPHVVDSLVADATPVAVGPAPKLARRPGARSALSRFRERFVDACVIAVGLVMALVWYGILALMAVAVVLAVIQGSSSDQPTSAGLRVVEERVVRAAGELRYVAVVRNTSATEAALRIHPVGAFLGRDGEPLAVISSPEDVTLRPSLGPGEEGVVVDLIAGARGIQADDVEEIVVDHLAEREPMPTERPPLPRLDAVGLDRDTCNLTIRIRSPEPLERVRVGVVIRDRSGAITSGGWFPLRGIESGTSRRILRGEGPCPGFMREVELHPAPNARQLLGRPAR